MDILWSNDHLCKRDIWQHYCWLWVSLMDLLCLPLIPSIKKWFSKKGKLPLKTDPPCCSKNHCSENNMQKKLSRETILTLPFLISDSLNYYLILISGSFYTHVETSPLICSAWYGLKQNHWFPRRYMKIKKS